jgi:hypothetical protein
MWGIDLAEAHELVKHDIAAIVSYPLRHTGKKRTSDEQDDEREDRRSRSRPRRNRKQKVK